MRPIRRLLGAALLLAIAGAAPLAAAEPHKAADDSFLFSSRTLALIEAARSGQRPAAAAVARSAPAAPTGSLHLAAIVYHGPDDWRIWLNGQSFTPRARPRAIEILEVTADAVVLVWREGPGAAPTRVELRPNQSYLVASGRVVEGKAGARR